MRALLLSLALAACQVIPPPEPVSPTVPVEPGADHCEAACANLERLHCEWAEPTPGQDDLLGTEDDGQCVDICRNAEDDVETSLNPGCIAKADSCETAEACVQ